MALYEFKCFDCNSEFEEFCSYEEIKNMRCNRCNSDNIGKLLSLSGIIFKGSGFYVNDYKDDKRKDFRNEVGEELFKGDIDINSLDKGKIKYTERGLEKRPYIKVKKENI